MKKNNCKVCAKYNIIKDDLIFDRLNVKRINEDNGRYPYKNIKNKRFHLWKCLNCDIFWEWRPLYEETMYGGEPGEWVKVTEEYVKEHYPGVLD